MGSLCDGSGGFPLGGQMADIKPLWAAEIEPFPIRVTHKHFPNMKHLGNIEKINGAEIEPVDIITFGSPCTNLAVCGNRTGIHGEKSSLFFECIRVIREMRDATNGKYPSTLVWENVFGAFSSGKGEDFYTIIKEFCSLAGDREIHVPRPKRWEKAGTILADSFSLAWRTFNSQYWGVPQSRRRIYLVECFRKHGGGGHKEYTLAPEILFDPKSVSGDSAPSA